MAWQTGATPRRRSPDLAVGLHPATAAVLRLLLLTCCVWLAASEGVSVCQDVTQVDEEESFSLSIECLSDSVTGSLHVSEGVDPLQFYFASAVYCTLPDGSMDSDVFINEWSANEKYHEESQPVTNLPPETHCTVIGCFRRPFSSDEYLIQNVSCTIPPSATSHAVLSATPSLSLSPSSSLPPPSSLHQLPLLLTTSALPSPPPSLAPVISTSLQQITPSTTPSDSTGHSVTVLAVTTSTSVVTLVLLLLLCLAVTLHLNCSHTRKTLKVGDDNWKREVLRMDYHPLDLTKPIAPAFTSQESLLNILSTTEQELSHSSAISSSVPPPTTTHHHTLTVDSTTDTSTGGFRATRNFKGILVPVCGAVGRSMSSYALSTGSSCDSSGYSTGCSSDSMLPLTSLSLVQSSSESALAHTLDLAVPSTDQRPSPGKACEFNLSSDFRLSHATQTRLHPSRNAMLTPHTDRGTEMEKEFEAARKISLTHDAGKQAIGTKTSDSTFLEERTATTNPSSVPQTNNNNSSGDKDCRLTLSPLKTLIPPENFLCVSSTSVSSSTTEHNILNMELLAQEEIQNIKNTTTHIKRNSHDLTDVGRVVHTLPNLTHHSFNVATNTSSGNSLVDYAGYLHLETPL